MPRNLRGVAIDTVVRYPWRLGPRCSVQNFVALNFAGEPKDPYFLGLLDPDPYFIWTYRIGLRFRVLPTKN
jgi:hypothetical protein